jgi:hypothetical protein
VPPRAVQTATVGARHGTWDQANGTLDLAPWTCKRRAKKTVGGTILWLRWRTSECAGQWNQMRVMDSPLAGGHDNQCAASLAIATRIGYVGPAITPYPSHGNDMFLNWSNETSVLFQSTGRRKQQGAECCSYRQCREDRCGAGRVMRN